MKLHLKNDSPYLVPRYEFWEIAIPAAISVGTAIYNGIKGSQTEKKQESYADKANKFAREQYEYNKAFTREQYEYDKAFTREQVDYNRAFAREQYDYNKQLNAELISREDNAYQRAVADAQAAGLSPLTVAGTGGAGTGGTVSASQQSVGTASTGSYSVGGQSFSNPNLDARAQQIETNTFSDMIHAMAQKDLQERQISADSNSQEDQQKFEYEKQSAMLDAQDKMLDKQLDNAQQLQDKNDRQKELDRIQERKIFNATQRNIMEARSTQELSAASHEGMKAAANLGVKNFHFFTDRAKYEQALSARSVGAQTRASDAWRMTEGYDETTTNSGSASLSGRASASAGAGPVGVGASAEGTESGSSSQTLHSSAVQMMNQAEVEYWNKNGYPVFVGSYHHKDIN